MTDYKAKQKYKKSKIQPASAVPSTLQQTETDTQLIHRSLQTDLHTPKSIMALQRRYGNQAVMRMLSTENNTVVQRTPLSHTGQNVIQRGPLKAFAKSQVFGSRSERKEIPDLQGSNRFDHVDENVQIPSTDKVTLRGRYYFANDMWKGNGNATGKTVLFLSGSGGSAEKYSYDVAKAYCEQGADVLAVNYRGFGQSKQRYKNIFGKRKERNITPTEQGIFDDAQSMFTWLGQQGVAPADVIIHGYSLGGAVAANLAAHLAEQHIDVAGMVMHSPMPNTEDPAKDASEEMLGSISKSGARKLGKMIAGWANAPFDTTSMFQRLAAVKPDFPVFFLSGTYADGDHLGLGYTNIDNTAQVAGLTNTESHEVDGDHFDTGDHMTNARDELETWLQNLTPDQVEDVDQVLEGEGIPDDVLAD